MNTRYGIRQLVRLQLQLSQMVRGWFRRTRIRKKRIRKYHNDYLRYTMSKIAVFPGTFDPVTIGHVDIVNRASELFDEIIIAIGVNTKKTTLFDLQVRKQWIQTAFANNPKVRIESYEGLTVDFCKKMGAKFLLRGLRNGTDFDYESHIAQLNKALWNEIETVFIMCDPAMSYVSSTLIRDLIIHKADYARYLPEGVTPA